MVSISVFNKILVVAKKYKKAHLKKMINILKLLIYISVIVYENVVKYNTREYEGRNKFSLCPIKETEIVISIS